MLSIFLQDQAKMMNWLCHIVCTSFILLEVKFLVGLPKNVLYPFTVMSSWKEPLSAVTLEILYILCCHSYHMRRRKWKRSTGTSCCPLSVGGERKGGLGLTWNHRSSRIRYDNSSAKFQYMQKLGINPWRGTPTEKYWRKDMWTDKVASDRSLSKFTSFGLLLMKPCLCFSLAGREVVLIWDYLRGWATVLISSHSHFTGHFTVVVSLN